MGVNADSIFLKDGAGTTVDFSLFPSVRFSELTLQAPGVQGGGPINTSGLRNQAVRTQAPRVLTSVPATTGTCKYDARALETIHTMRQVNQLITVTHPDGSTTVGWGWLESFLPQASEEGTQPTADFTIEWSNVNSSGVETRPFTSGVT